MTFARGDPAPAPTLTARMRAAAQSTYTAILVHPFVTGVSDGSLDRTSFQFYLVQDAHYLQGFARALALLAARAATDAATELFAHHAATVIKVERGLHEQLLAELGSSHTEPSLAGVAPTTLAYRSFLLATCATGSFAEGVASVLPCYWIYRDVGSALLTESSPDPLYARWIATYGGDEFERAVDEMIELTNVIGATLTAAEQQSAIDHFVISARYEWLFWDAAWHRADWPV